MPHNEFKAKGEKQPEITPEGQDQLEIIFTGLGYKQTASVKFSTQLD